MPCCKILEFDDDEDDDEEEVEKESGNTTQMVNIGPTIKAAAGSQMEAAVDAFSRELLKLRTGRASAGKGFCCFLKLMRNFIGLVIYYWICRDA